MLYNSSKNSPIQQAASLNNTKILSYLIEHGADVNVTRKNVNKSQFLSYS
jgi:ankyrin repeat protein